MNSLNKGRTKSDGVVIAGGGLAGQRCAEALRRHGYDGTLRFVSAEEHRPYDRPPLSKELLAGERAEPSLSYRSGDWYNEHSIDLLQGLEAVGLQPRERRLSLSDGGAIRYARLLIATGSRPRALPILAGYENVSVLRTLDDSTALRDVLSERPHLVVIGAGFIGQEVSATARKLDCRVTMVEAAPCPLGGLLGSQVGRWFTRLHETEGVEVICGCTVERVGGDGRVRRLRLSNGATLEADHVVVGVGVDPETRWLAGSGLDAARGVAVDQHGRTAIHGVLAAGDAAATFDPKLGQHVPGSHWEAAARQGSRAARVMLGLAPGAAPLTSFWTDQYGIRIQYLGRSRHSDSVVIDGDPDSRSFTAAFVRDGHTVGALLVDRPRALPGVRKLIEQGVT